MNIEFALDGKTRDKPVADDYLSALDSVLKATDPRLGARIVSAGQDPKGSGGKRTGSTRHDVDHTGHSHTSDLVLTLDGQEIRPGDNKALYAKFLRNAAPKFPGIGHYDWGVHIGDGSLAMWGPDKTSKSIDPIFAKAISDGRSGKSMPERKKVSDPAILAKLNGSTVNKLNGRPNLPNEDGSFSTELSITVTNPRLNGGKPTNIPSIWDGRRFDPNTQEDAIVEQALKSGQTFPAFASIDEAVSAARGRSEGLSAGTPTGRKKVTDPSVLAKLNGATSAGPEANTDGMFNADRFGPSAKGDRVIPASARGSMQGTEPGIAERVGNALYDAGKAIGLPVDRMRNDNQSADAFVRGAADVVSVGTADEIAAAADTATGLSGKQGDYEGNLRYQRAQDDYDAATQPVARTAGQLGGGVLAGTVAAPRMAAANAWGRMKQGAVMGGLSGGAYGFGSGEGIEDRAQGAATGAAVGSAIGLAIPAATSAVRTGYNSMMDYTVRPVGNAIRSVVAPERNAMRLAQRSLARDGLAPEDAAAKMQGAIDAGDDTMTLMDVAGDNTRRLGRFASNIPGEGADKINQTVYDRQLAQPERVVSAIREGLDDPERYFGTIDDIIVQRQAASKPLYDKAYATPVPFTRKLEGLLGRGKVMRDALKRARDLGEAEGIPSQQFFAKIADDGSYTIESVPDARQWDLMKRSLDDIIEGEKTVLPNGTEKLSNLGRVVSGIKREMLDEIDRVNPDYAAARKVYSSASDSLDAVTEGGKLLDADPELARRKLAAMSEGEKQLARLGLSKAMTDRVQRMKDGANTVRAIFASPKHRAVLKEAFPDEKSFTGFQDAMEREAQKTRTKNAIGGNSTTAQQMTDIADNQVDMGVIGNLATGRFGAAAGAIVQKALSRATVVNEATAKELANILTTSDPKVAAQIMGEMQRMAMKDKRVAKNLLAVRSFLRNSGVATATQQTTEALTK